LRLRLAQIKVVPQSRQLRANHDRLLSILGSVADHQPDVVITPEGYLDGYVAMDPTVSRETIGQYAIDPDHSAYARAIAAWAAAHRSWFILGCARIGADSSTAGVYNSALVYGRDGRLVGIYDKTHIQTHDMKYLAGQSLPVFPSDFGPFGVMICADRRWPETVRTLALKGARVIFNPTYGFHDDKNLHMMQTRSFESESFIAFTHPSQSLVTDPTGEIVINETSDEIEFVVSEIDLDQVDRVRAGEGAHLGYRRPDLYEL
jgi:predicted amidohydrolase